MSDGRAEWNIECKRLVGWSDYSTQERKKWLRMWQPLATRLWEKKLALVFEICFHVELESLPDDFVIRELAGKLTLMVVPCTLISNREWTVQVRRVDMDKIQAHLSRSFVKQPSDQLQELIIGRRVRQGGTTCAFSGQGGTLGPPTGTNGVIQSIDWAAGAVRDCDAPRANEAKARDIRAQLSRAVEQLPANVPAAVHLGLDTLDGWPVEQERFERIMRTVGNFDTKGKKLYWIYCHLFQAYSPPEKDFEFDETVLFLQSGDCSSSPPIQEHSIIVPDELGREGVHWHPGRL